MKRKSNMMMKKTIAPLFLLTLFTATAAEAREPKQKEVRVAAAPAPAPAPAAPAPAPAPAQTQTPSESGAVAKAETKGEEVDEEPSPDGISIGVRVGYALPLGSIAKDPGLNGTTDLSSSAAGMVPFWADIGYRVNPRWYVGGYFQYGIIGTAGDLCKRNANGGDCSSSGNDIRFGAHVRYKFSPNAKIAPWAGISSGYEITNLSATVGANTTDVSIKGWEFIGLHIGADLHPSPAVSIGPVLMASFGQYGSASSTESGTSKSHDYTNPALHEWFFFGLRGQYDL